MSENFPKNSFSDHVALKPYHTQFPLFLFSLATLLWQEALIADCQRFTETQVTLSSPLQDPFLYLHIISKKFVFQ